MSTLALCYVPLIVFAWAKLVARSEGLSYADMTGIVLFTGLAPVAVVTYSFTSPLAWLPAALLSSYLHALAEKAELYQRQYAGPR